MNGIFNAILVEGDQIFGHFCGDWEVELGGPHEDMEGFMVKPFLGDFRGFKSLHLPVVDSLEEGCEKVTNIF